MKTFALFAILLLFSPTTVIAQELEEQVDPLSQQPLLRRATTSKVRNLTDRIDDLFGTERTDENRRFSTLRVSGRHTLFDGYPSETSYNVRLMLRPATFQNWSAQADRWLKRKKDRLINFRTGSMRSESIAAETNEFGEVEPGDETVEMEVYESIRMDEDVALYKDEEIDEVFMTKEDYETQDQPRELNPWRLSFDQRFRLDSNNFFEGRLKTTRDFEWGQFLHHAVFDIRWSAQREWESAFSTISSYSISDSLLFQFGNSFNWLLTARGFESTHGPSLFYTISSSKAISLSFTTAVGTSPWWINAYTISSVYRQHIYEDWIDFSVNPYRSYTRVKNFNPDTGIIFNAEVAF